MSISIYGTSFDAADAAAIAAFWGEALGRAVNPGATRQSASLAAREGTDEAPIMFHGVPEPKTVKNRLHLDLRPRDQTTEVARLEALGARRVDVGQGEVSWVVLADPDGNEFCVLKPLSAS